MKIYKMWRRISRGMFGELDGGWSAQEANGALGWVYGKSLDGDGRSLGTRVLS